jgi:glycosyltransferase involved in cell wall biosynthesis
MSVQQLSISVIIPAYNEEGAIEQTVSIIAGTARHFQDLEIVVVNDGSKDKTHEIASAIPGITYIRHPKNRGYGAALKTGMQAAKHPYILIADADGTYPLDEIPRLAADAAEHDMVVGARTGSIVQVPLLRRPGKWIITRLAEYLSGEPIPDLNSGLRIFRKDVALKFLPLYPDGFSFTTTITLAMLTNHYRVKFVSINYMKRVGKSSIKPIRDFTNFTILIIRVCAYFKPLNVFVPPSMVLMGSGTIKAFRDYAAEGKIGIFAVVLFLIGFQLLFLGLLADMIDRRMKL